MRLPEQLRDAIEVEAARVDSAALKRAAAHISERYRAGNFVGALAGPAERAAYLLTRMPATYAADSIVFRELRERVLSPVRSLLDLGAGPGTAMWCAAEEVPTIERFTAIERYAESIAIGRRLAANHPTLQKATWMQSDLRSHSALVAHDIVVLSYSLSELTDPIDTVQSAWKLANIALVIVEPGTPKAFQVVVRARDVLIDAGAIVAAPCPHHGACPLAVRNDWCHFSVRLERTAAHRRLKGADLGYEDEKFSYIVATKSRARQAEGRVVRHPLKHPGHVKLTLCTPNDLQDPTIGKSQKQLYRAARKVDWGDEWPPQAATLSET